MGQRTQRSLLGVQEAVDDYRQLVARQLDAFLHLLAMSLINLAKAQNELGQRDEALASTQEAADILGPITSLCLEAFERSVAVVLSNLLKQLEELGQFPRTRTAPTGGIFSTPDSAIEPGRPPFLGFVHAEEKRKLDTGRDDHRQRLAGRPA